jgi:serine O-acetyltransferase
MQTSLSREEISKYLERQLITFFPDNQTYGILDNVVEYTLQKLQYNFQHIKLDYFWKNGAVYFNHLNADQYTIFVYYASNIAFEDFQNEKLASKLFYLNKILHGFHCMYDTKLPDIFLVIHGSGIVLGKAKYDDYFVVTHGVTVGSNSKWEAPTLGKRIVMYPNSSIIGNATISNDTCFSMGSRLMDIDTFPNSLVFGESPNIVLKKQKEAKIQIYFNNFNEKKL